MNRDSPEEKVLDFYDRMIILTKVSHQERLSGG